MKNDKLDCLFVRQKQQWVTMDYKRLLLWEELSRHVLENIFSENLEKNSKEENYHKFFSSKHQHEQIFFEILLKYFECLSCRTPVNSSVKCL